MSILSKVLIRAGLTEERRRDGRSPASGLTVLYGPVVQQKEAQIRDISPSGIFLLTPERLQPGEKTILTLCRKPALSRHSRSRVQLWARAVRQNEQGVGLTFARDGADPSLWLKMVVMAAPLAAPDDVIDRFRIARTLSFLAQRSAPVQNQIAEQMNRALGSERRERLITMVLTLEEQLEQTNPRARSHVAPDLMRQILLMGSSAEEPRMQSLWQRLLYTSCLAVHREEDSLRLAEILPQFLPIDVDLFSAACEKTLSGIHAPGEIYCPAEELIEIAHASLINIEQHLHHLHFLGLLGRTEKPLKGETIRRANLTVTSLGLQLYARCFEPSESLAEALCR